MDGNNSENAQDEAKSLVDELYRFRDHYFTTHSMEDAVHKNDHILSLMNSTLEQVNSLQEKINNKAYFLMLQGRLLNVTEEFNEDSFNALIKAVKLDPKLAEAWNELGECYWKKSDIEAAKKCYLGALKHGKDKVVLRNLSKILRFTRADDPQKKVELFNESIEKGKEAIKLDVTDGLSWVNLGNAYLTLFLGTKQSAAIKLCINAYNQAEKDPVAKNLPSVHYNRAQVCKYEEHYQEALDGFSHALALDPLWKEAQEAQRIMLEYLRNTSDAIKNRGNFKSRKLETVLDSIKESHLGPYKNGAFHTQLGPVVDLEYCFLKDLTRSVVNENRVVLGKVISHTQSEKNVVPYPFVMMDKFGDCCAVTVYDNSEAFTVNKGDSVAIPEPYFSQVNVHFSDEIFEFTSLRVPSPLVLVVNSKKVKRDKQANTELVVLNV